MIDIMPRERCTKIKVIGIGSAGSNAINRMLEDGVDGVEFILITTDRHDLDNSKTPNKLLIGEKIARGMGAGGKPEVGMNAAEESRKEISNLIDGADMVIMIVGMGGGTGTGSTPIIAEIAKLKGILTIGIVTKPYHYEGSKRIKCALEGIKKLKDNVDTLIVISNQKLLEIIDKPANITTEFLKKSSDEVFSRAVQGITNLITKPAFIELDFADISAIMSNKGFAYIGIGRASGKNKFEEAVMKVIKNPLLETSGASNVLLSIAHNKNSSLSDIDKAVCLISETLDTDTTIIFGTYANDDLEDEVIITIIGIELNEDAESFAHSEAHSDIDASEIALPFTLAFRRQSKNI